MPARSLPVLLAVAVLCLGAGARGQEQAEPDGDAVTRSEEILVEEETLRPAEIFQDTPVETEILTDEEIERLPGTNAAEIVRNLPGIRSQRRLQGETAAVSIEGMPPEYTRILVNGQRYSGEVGGVDDLRDVPLENVERIEVLRGAQGLRYGPEAGGGVINIITRDPPREGGQADGRAGMGSDRNIQASGTLGYGGHGFGGSASYTHDQIDGFDPPEDLGSAVFVPSGSDSQRLARDFYSTLMWSDDEGLTTRTRLGWRRTDEDFVFEAAPDDTSRRDVERGMATQEAEWWAGEATRLQGAFTYYTEETDSGIGRTFDIDEAEWRVEGAVEHFVEIGPFSNLLTLGTDFRSPSLSLTEGALPAGIQNDALGPADLRESFHTTGIFGILETDLTDWFALEAGARGQFDSRFDPQLVPQGALIVTPWQSDDGRSLKFRLQAGRNFRAPSLRELFQPAVPQLGGAYFLAGNPDLEPETSTSYRAGVEFNPFSWLSTSLVGFHNEIDDHIRSTNAGTIPIGTQTIVTEGDVVEPRPGLGLICEVTENFFPDCSNLVAGGPVELEVPISSPLFRKTNLDTVMTRGVEARLHLLPSRYIDLQVGYTYLDTEVVDSNVNLEELPNEARHVVDARLLLVAPRIDTELTLRSRWRSGALIETSGTGLLSFGSQELSEPSLVLDARLVQPINPHLELFADFYNLTDTRVVDSYVVRGRTFLVGFRARWK